VLAGAIAGGQDGAPLRSLLGLVLHQLGDLSGCERELREAVRLAPGDGAAEFALASICYRLGNEADAEAATRRAIAAGLDDSHAYLLLGRILGPAAASYRRRQVGAIAGGVYLVTVLALFALFWPIWTDQLITTPHWLQRIWFHRWI